MLPLNDAAFIVLEPTLDSVVSLNMNYIADCNDDDLYQSNTNMHINSLPCKVMHNNTAHK